eukprot:Tbor_TRINITY_DN5957_c3_g2::TRINITY_DN5957_c3_g2_i1::g.19314::m.19314
MQLYRIIEEQFGKKPASNSINKERAAEPPQTSVIQMLQRQTSIGNGPGKSDAQKLKVILWNARCSIHEIKMNALLAHNADIYLLQEVQRELVPPPGYSQHKDKR